MHGDPPDPAGPMPEGWDPLRWTAYRAFRLEGASYADVARRVGRARSTVSRWVMDWRLQWGRDVVKSANRNKITDEQRKRGQLLGGIRIAVDARARRQVEHDGYQELSARGGDWIARWMEAQEERDLSDVTVEDVLRMARLMEVLGRRMHQLVPPEATGPALGAGTAEQDWPDLSELEAAGEADHGEDMAAIETILAAFRVEVLGQADAEPEPIEVTAREAS